MEEGQIILPGENKVERDNQKKNTSKLFLYFTANLVQVAIIPPKKISWTDVICHVSHAHFQNFLTHFRIGKCTSIFSIDSFQVI